MGGRRTEWVVKCGAVGCIALIAAILAPCAEGAWMALEPGAETDAPAVAVLDADRGGLRIGATIPGMEREEVTWRGDAYQQFAVPGGGETGEVGSPALPAVTRLIAIPWQGGAEVHVTSVDSIVIGDVDILPTEGWRLDGYDEQELHFDPAVYGRDDYYPRSIARLGDPVIMRDLRLVQLVIYPLRYNPILRELHVYRDVEVEIVFTEEGGNEKVARRPRPSAAFEDLYRSLVLNYDELGRDGDGVERGSYLIITHDQYLEEIAPLAQWKQRKGWNVVVTPLSEIGSSPSANDIRDYISDAYYTWEIPPEYVFLIGDHMMGSIGQFPTFFFSSNNNCTDLPFTLIEGNDYFPEMLIGRASIDSESEANVVVAKTLGYERDPYMGSTDWYIRGLVVATTDHAYSCKTTKLYVLHKMLDNGFAEVDSVWHPPHNGPEEIMASINEGVSFVNYRGWGGADGWWEPSFSWSNIQSLSNGWKLPLMTSIICNTGDFANNSYDPCFGEAWIRSGTTSNPKGGPAFFGPSEYYTHTKWNNCIDSGIYWGIFDDKLVAFAQAMFRGKIELYSNFPNNTNPGDWVEFYFHVYNVLGDPELNMWTAVPQEMTGTHASSIPLGTNYLTVDVEIGPRPAQGSLVCLYKEDEVFTRQYADSDGSATMVFDPGTTGDLLVTATERNGEPYLGSVSIDQASRFVGYVSYAIDDDNNGGSQGNGDGYVNPGETIELTVELENWGTQTASSVMGYLTTDDPFVTVTDGEESYGTIAPGATALCAEDFDFEVSLSCPSNHVIPFVVRATSGGEDYYTVLEIPVRAPDLVYVEHEVLGGNGVLDPGETADLVVTLRNDGLLDVSGVVATLRSTDLWFEIGQSVGSFGTIGAGGTATNTASPFEVGADGALRDGYGGEFVLEVTGDGGYEATVPFELRVGTTGTNDPMGPDEYGYFAYDNTDGGYPERPSYSWVEIDPNYGGSGTQMSLYEDDVDTLSLPFTFRYYGQEYDELSVATNGFAALGATWVAIPRNWGIPAAFGPDAMLAPFWDELKMGTGHVYYYYDMPHDRFIVEWSRLRNEYGSEPIETFQLVLYDPVYYETATGDGEIVFQYETVSNIDSNENYATVGIEEPGQRYGLEYTFANHYAPEAAALAAGRAIKFTTDSPHLPAIGLELEPDATVYHRGETLGYTAHVTNNTSQGQSVVGRADVTLPNGNPFGGNPVVGPKPLTLSAGQSRNPHVTHYIPPPAPFGSYIYTVTIENGEGEVVAEEEFVFTVVP